MKSLKKINAWAQMKVPLYSFYNASVLIKVFYTCLRFPSFQLKRQWKNQI